jgi:phage portal protein BeeE
VGLLEILGLARTAATPATSTAPPATVGPTRVPYLDGRSALALSAVWRCVTLIADVIADWQWTEWKGDELLEPSRLVRRPMVTMSRREWTWRVVATEALYSTCHLLHVGGSDSEGGPWSLLPVPPAAIAPIGYVDPYGLLPPTAYVVAGRRVDAQYVTVIRRTPFPGVPDWLNGVINLARTQFGAYLAADIAAARYWQAGGPVTTVIETAAEMDDPEADAIARRWIARRSMGADYPAVLSSGTTAKPWGADPTAEASVESRREDVAMVGRYFGMPTRILNAPAGDSETYSNVENDAIDLYRMCLRGHAGPVEDAISEILPGDALAGRRMAMDASRFLQGDLASRAIAWPALVQSGIVDTDEARTRGFGLPPRTAAQAAAAAVAQVMAAQAHGHIGPPTPTVTVSSPGGPPA